MESTMSTDRKLANVVGAKSARACDNCVKRRARWYCAADDAFLCHSCDSSVHSANPLARRHERVRLKTAPPSPPDDESLRPTWHARKPRTPRQKKTGVVRIMNDNLVPEICSEENSNSNEEESEEQLLYRVPTLDPFVSVDNLFDDPNKPASGGFNVSHFLPTEMDLDEFAADFESLLGNGVENETFDMEGLGILDVEKETRLVKMEEIEEAGEVMMNREGEFVDIGRDGFVLDFDYHDSPVPTGDDDDNVKPPLNDSKKIFLRLDYESIISAWDDHKSPWTTGERPDLDSSECWPDCVSTTCGTMHAFGETGVMKTQTSSIMADGGREARVSRYREKRRTRLFSKKIRYEVRKLNAEKRPRMKGRFVKRTNFVSFGE